MVEELTIVGESGSRARPRARVIDKATRRRVLNYFVLEPTEEEKEKGDCVRDVEGQTQNGKTATTYDYGAAEGGGVGAKGAKAASGGVGDGGGSGGGSTSGRHRGGGGGGGGRVGSPLRSPPPYVSPPPSYTSAVSRLSALGQSRRSDDATTAVAVEEGAATREVGEGRVAGGGLLLMPVTWIWFAPTESAQWLLCGLKAECFVRC